MYNQSYNLARFTYNTKFITVFLLDLKCFIDWTKSFKNENVLILVGV